MVEQLPVLETGTDQMPKMSDKKFICNFRNNSYFLYAQDNVQTLF